MKIVQITTDNREQFRHYDADAPEFGTAPAGLLDGFSRLPGLEVHVISCVRRTLKCPAKPAGNIHFHSLVVPKVGWLSTGYQGCIRAVRRKLRQLQPDVVHGQGTERDCAMDAAFSGFPNVLTLHGNMRMIAHLHRARPFSHAWWTARMEGFILPRTDGVVCISSYTRNAVAPLARRTWVLPNAVDASCFDIVPVPSPCIEILCVGTVDERKNQVALIRAIDSMPRPANFELIFLGSTTAGSAYESEFLDLVKARPWCRHVGFLDRKGLHAALASASGLILASLEDNCPMVVLEAMAAGVPVAASNVGGVPDLIRDGENGILLNPLDTQSIVDAMQRLLQDDARKRAIHAREEARRRFHPEHIARCHVEIYREVIAARQR